MSSKKTIDQLLTEEIAGSYRKEKSRLSEKMSQEDQAFRWVCKHVLPFVNARDCNEALRAFCLTDAELKLDYQAESREPVAVEKFLSVRQSSFKSGGRIQEILDMQKFLKGVLDICLLNNPPHISDKTSSIEERMQSAYPVTATIVEWRGYGSCGISQTTAAIKDPVVDYEHSAVRNIVACLYSWVVDDHGVISPWVDKVGVCPNCGIFFERKRKDQEYCSGKCKDTALKRRKRRSVKD